MIRKLTLVPALFLIMLISFCAEAQHSVARLWNDQVLEAIRNDFARPTVHARNLYHISSAMYDAWAAYDTIASNYLLGDTVGGFACPFEGFNYNGDIKEARNEAISHAVYNLIARRFSRSPGATQILADARSLMDSLGYDWGNRSAFYQNGSPANLGNYIALCYLSFGFGDNSNEQIDYRNLSYEPVNPPLILELPGNDSLKFFNRWQPLTLSVFIDQSGNVIPGATPDFLSPEWGKVTPFSLQEEDLTIYTRDNFDYYVYYDPGPPSLMDTTENDSSLAYKWGFELVSKWSSQLDPSDGVMWDISPASLGNVNNLPETFEEYQSFYKEEGGDASVGHTQNPYTGMPYEEELVPRGDYTRVLAEFWADGPDSETPPGHWFVLLNYVNDHPLFEKKFKGEGPVLDELEWDVKSYFMLGGCMHDAAITAWGIKGWYDYIRPVSAIRGMARLGQSTDPSLPNYHEGGVRLDSGYIEMVDSSDALAGMNFENVGKIKLLAWKGPDFIIDPDTSQAGVDWILAEDWFPYQRPSFVTPPFAGYVSGHSTYSRAAAELMTLLTGDEFFPGGIGEFVAKKNEFLVFEEGPSVDVKLQWATYRDASDQTSLSRIWGGIHPPIDDIPGRKIGIELGVDAFHFAERYFYRDADKDGFFDFEDCDDNNANVYPGAPEICDGFDNNCNGEVNEGLQRFKYYADIDQDGYGDVELFIDTCTDTAPLGFSIDSTDCDDNDASINPGAMEICDGIDQNCDGILNNGIPILSYFRDRDNDGFGDRSQQIDTCALLPPTGYVQDNTDCDDSDPTVNPNAPEVCDGKDNNCDGNNNEGLTYSVYYRDSDGDGYGVTSSAIDTCLVNAPAGYSERSGDCDDTNPAVNPDAIEVCDNIDNNCDGNNNEGLTFVTYYPDMDGDGFGVEEGSIDTCLLAPPAGFVDQNGDCDDTNAMINPDAPEVCDNVDNDCDGRVNNGLPRFQYYQDNDGDGFGPNSTQIDTCADQAPPGYVLAFGDCDDTNAAINPNASEICDNIDNDCDGQINNGLMRFVYYQDTDGDGFGDELTPLDTCIDQAPQGFVSVSGDCDDTNAMINPDAVEVCDDIDNNCDGNNNEGLSYTTFFEDTDGDGFGNDALALDTCLSNPPQGYALEGNDCDDTNANVYPGAPEIADNGIDEDCSGEDLYEETKVFPNPFRNDITIHFVWDGLMTVYIISVDSKIFIEKEVEFVNNSATMELGNIPRGVYILRGYDEIQEELFSVKIVRHPGDD